MTGEDLVKEQQEADESLEQFPSKEQKMTEWAGKKEMTEGK